MITLGDIRKAGEGLPDSTPILLIFIDEDAPTGVSFDLVKPWAGGTLSILASVERPLIDFDGEEYEPDLVYYQPEKSLKDKDGNQWSKCDVWTDKSLCQSLFPGQEILDFSGDDIEEPRFTSEGDQP